MNVRHTLCFVRVHRVHHEVYDAEFQREESKPRTQKMAKESHNSKWVVVRAMDQKCVFVWLKKKMIKTLFKSS